MYQKIPLNKIKFTERKKGRFWNARRNFDEKSLESLRESIKEDGLRDAPTVRPLGNGDYEIVAGERRLRSVLYLVKNNEKVFDKETKKQSLASKVYTTVECQIEENCSDEQAIRLSVTENLHRENINEHDWMTYCYELCTAKDDTGSEIYSRKDVARLLQRSGTWISQTMNLCELPERALKLLANGVLTRSMAVFLLKVDESRIDDYLKLAESIQCIDNEKEISKLSDRVADLQDRLATLDIEEELATTTTKKNDISNSRKLLQKHLADAEEKKHTAKNRQPRITQTALEKAGQQMNNALVGKTNALSHKAIRDIYKDLSERMVQGGLQHVSGEPYRQEHLEIIQITLKGVLEGRHPLDSLSEYYDKEMSWNEELAEVA